MSNYIKSRDLQLSDYRVGRPLMRKPVSNTAEKWVKVATACVAVAASCVAGTGINQQKVLIDYSRQTGQALIRVGGDISALQQTPGVAKYIVETFSLSVSELGRIVGVSRQSVHEWLNDGEPSSENLKKLVALEDIGRRLKKAGLAPNAQMLRRVVSDQGSLAEQVRSDSDYSAILDKVLAILVDEKRQREVLASRISVDVSTKSTDEFGVPFYSSRA